MVSGEDFPQKKNNPLNLLRIGPVKPHQAVLLLQPALGIWEPLEQFLDTAVRSIWERPIWRKPILVTTNIP